MRKWPLKQWATLKIKNDIPIYLPYPRDLAIEANYYAESKRSKPFSLY